jgi:hypothetical protein
MKLSGKFLVMFLQLVVFLGFFVDINESQSNLPDTPLPITKKVRCIVGYGQSGAAFAEEQTHPMFCHGTHYCWRAKTDRTNINKLKNMFVFPWLDYYEEYFVLGCGGYLGTPKDDPWRPIPVPLGFIAPTHMQITVNETVVLPGDSLNMEIVYTCHGDYCSPAANRFGVSTLLAVMTTALSVYFLS